MKRWQQGLVFLIVLSFIVPMFNNDRLSSNMKVEYPLISVSREGTETSYIYRATDADVPTVAKELSQQRKPRQMSETSTERMFLVYDKEIIHVQQDPDDSDNSLVEVSSNAYVKRNYSPSFLETYLMASLISDMFQGTPSRSGDYRGYSTKDTYQTQGQYRAPTKEDKKIVPPVTVNRQGSITKRSSDANAAAKPGQYNSSPASNNSKGSISRDSNQKNQKGGFFSKSTRSTPKLKMGKGRISRRR